MHEYYYPCPVFPLHIIFLFLSTTPSNPTLFYRWFFLPRVFRIIFPLMRTLETNIIALFAATKLFLLLLNLILTFFSDFIPSCDVSSLETEPTVNTELLLSISLKRFSPYQTFPYLPLSRFVPSELYSLTDCSSIQDFFIALFFPSAL